MPQAQNSAPLVFQLGPAGTATATGNNAAWQCACGRPEPLIGRSGAVAGATPGTEVVCPACKQRYFVRPDGYDQAAVPRVEEL
jgi:hypothetical protein